MCGIIGIVNQEIIDINIAKTMCAALSHRGPDADGVRLLNNDRVALGHRRLSIIDLTDSGTQPMTNEDGRIWVTYNGEIYNFESIRKELQKSGHIFRSYTDTEVILHAYEEWGINCVERFRGIFAFGLWDDRLKQLWLARDHLGVKPLYYYYDNDKLFFASELKAILAHPSVLRNVQNDALSDYLAYGYIPFDRSIIENVSKLPAGHHLLYSDGNLKLKEYWDVSYTGEIVDIEEAKYLLREALQDAVQLQLVGDVPVGVFLSGGVDSSAITAVMSQTYQRMHTFTIGFDEDEFDETKYAQQIATAFKTVHSQRKVSYEVARQIIPLFPSIYDEPFYDSSGIPTYIVSQLARTQVKVVLGGDGGDELFAGYKRYDNFVKTVGDGSSSMLQRAGLKMLWRSVSSAQRYFSSLIAVGDYLKMKTQEPVVSYFNKVGFLDYNTQRLLLHPHIGASISRDTLWLLRKYWRDSYPRVTAAQYVDLKTYLVDDILTKVDRASMFHGLEVRVPLLDHKLVELAFQISHDITYLNGKRKHLFKETISPLLPNNALSERKKGFSVPIETWLKNGLQSYATQMLLDGSLVNRAILNPKATEKFLLSCRPTHVWLLLALEMWARMWLDGDFTSPQVSSV